MPRKTRETTSVSTLVNNINSLILQAHTAGRQDLIDNAFRPLHARITAFTEEYAKLRAEIDPFVKRMLTTESVENILARVETE